MIGIQSAKRVSKSVIRKLLRRKGLELKPWKSRGRDPFEDMSYFCSGIKNPLIFDVGANIGQTAQAFKMIFPSSTIHSFEPSPDTFRKLREACMDLGGVCTWNCGVGSTHGTLPFIENNMPVMSSFLPPSRMAGGARTIRQKTEVEVITLDDFAKENEIDHVHILKSDTQGFELEVLKGSDNLLKQNRISLIYFEFIFSDMYEGLPQLEDVFSFLTSRKYRLACIYDMHYQQEIVSWTDFLFISQIAYDSLINRTA